LLFVFEGTNLTNALFISQYLTQERICRIRRIWNTVCATGVVHIHWTIIPDQVKSANTLLTAGQSDNEKGIILNTCLRGRYLFVGRNSVTLGQLPAAFLRTFHVLFSLTKESAKMNVAATAVSAAAASAVAVVVVVVVNSH